MPDFTVPLTNGKWCEYADSDGSVTLYDGDNFLAYLSYKDMCQLTKETFMGWYNPVVSVYDKSGKILARSCACNGEWNNYGKETT